MNNLLRSIYEVFNERHLAWMSHCMLIGALKAQVSLSQTSEISPDSEYSRFAKAYTAYLSDRDFSISEKEYDAIKDALYKISFDTPEARECIVVTLSDLYEESVSLRSRQDSGQFFTPDTVARFISEALPLESDSKIIDPACGSGLLLSYAALALQKNGGEEISVYGMEFWRAVAYTAQYNLSIVLGTKYKEDYIQIQSGLYPYQGEYKEKFDFVIMNPPYGNGVYGQQNSTWGAASLGETLFTDAAYSLVKDNGYVCAVMPSSILSRIKNNCLQGLSVLAIVDLPIHTFVKSGIRVNTCILFMRKLAEPRKGTVLRKKVQHVGYSVKGIKCSENELPLIAKEIKQYLFWSA